MVINVAQPTSRCIHLPYLDVSLARSGACPNRARSSALTGVESPSSTDVGAPALIETAQTMCLARDADADTDCARVDGQRRSREPKRAFDTEVDTIEIALDGEPRGQPTRAAREIPQRFDAAPALHRGNPFQRLE